MTQPGLVARDAVAVELAPTRHRPHVGCHVPLGSEHVGGPQRFGHRHPEAKICATLVRFSAAARYR